jgi:hypothetical protein
MSNELEAVPRVFEIRVRVRVRVWQQLLNILVSSISSHVAVHFRDNRKAVVANYPPNSPKPTAEDTTGHKWGIYGMIAAVIALIAAAVVGYHVYLSLQLPGEARVFFSALPVVGDALQLGKDPLRLFAAYRAKAGEIFGMVVMGQRMFFLTEPESFKVVLRADKTKVRWSDNREACVRCNREQRKRCWRCVTMRGNGGNHV